MARILYYEDWLDYDPERACAKCGNKNITTHYHAAGNFHGLRGISEFRWGFIIASADSNREHLFKRCLDCGYSWIELPADA